MNFIKLSILTIVLTGATSYNAISQHELKTNVLAFIGGYDLQYEYMTENVGFIIGFKNFNGQGSLFFDSHYTSYVITPEWRYYYNPNEHTSGLYTSLYTRLRMASSEDYFVTYSTNDDGQMIETGSSDLNNLGVAIGASLGYKWVTRSGVVFETFIGMGGYVVNNTTMDTYLPGHGGYSDNNEYQIPSFDFRAGFSVGYRFGH